MNPFSKQAEVDIEAKKKDLIDRYSLDGSMSGMLSKIKTEDDLIQFEEELKLYREDKSKVDKALSSINVFESTKDPMEIEPEELEKMMSYKTNSEQQKEVGEAISKVRRMMLQDEISKFVTKRGRKLSNGDIDTFVSSDELKVVERAVEEKLNKSQKDAGVRDSDKLSDLVNTLNDMSVESRYRYEGYKEIMCNDFGITPDSFDQWYAAILEENTERLMTTGIENKTDLYKVSDLQKKYSYLLKRVDNWKKGDIVYKSEFNAKVAELDAAELERAEKTATPEGRKLYKEMLADTYHPLDNPVRLKQGSVSKDDVGYFLRNRNSKKKVESKDEQPLIDKVEDQNKVERKHEPSVNLDDLISLNGPVTKIDGPDEVPMGERFNEDTGMIEKVPISEIFKHQDEPKEESKVNDKPRISAYMEYPEHMTKEKIEENLKMSRVIPSEEPSFKPNVVDIHETEKELVTEEANKVVEVISEEDPIIRKYLSMGLDRSQAELLAENDKRKNVTESASDPVKEVQRENVEIDPAEVKESRIKPNRGVIDDYAKYVETDADPSILRTSNNRLEALKLYKNSAKKGRRLFLPNSNYEVFVKKIKNSESIGYMISLINNTKDINLVESYIKTEILRVCYENIDFYFPEEVTYDDFVRCLHESDMTILMMMLALVNIPEDKDGKIPLNVKSLLCTNPDCGAVGHFKESIKLDLKEEFVNIYPVDLFATQYNLYKSSNYPTIYHAYRAGTVGKMNRYTVDDDESLVYEFITSAPTIYKSQAVKSARDEVTYRRLIDRISSKIDLYIRTNAQFEDVVNYLETHTYQEYFRELNDMRDSIIEVDNNRKNMFMLIADELELLRQNDLPWYLIMDVIDQINVTSKDGQEVISHLDQKDIYTMIGVLEQCPKSMLDIIIETKDKTIDKSYPVDIVFNAEDVAGKFDFDGYYGNDDEVREELTNRYKDKDIEEDKLESIIERQLTARRNVKPDYNDKGICFCKNTKWKLNYTAILFFWISNLSLTDLR